MVGRYGGVAIAPRRRRRNVGIRRDRAPDFTATFEPLRLDLRGARCLLRIRGDLVDFRVADISTRAERPGDLGDHFDQQGPAVFRHPVRGLRRPGRPHHGGSGRLVDAAVAHTDSGRSRVDRDRRRLDGDRRAVGASDLAPADRSEC